MGLRLIGPPCEKTCLRGGGGGGVANNKGADQPAHPRSLISAFVIHFSKSIISKLATSEISSFKLVFVAEETALSLALLKTPKTGFLVSQPNLQDSHKWTNKFVCTFTLWSYCYGNLGFITHSGVIVKLPSNKGWQKWELLNMFASRSHPLVNNLCVVLPKWR